MLIKYLVMTFKTEDGDKANLTVSGLKEDLTAQEIAAAVDVIIAKDAFVSKGGKLLEKYNAQIVTRNVDEFDLA